MSLNGSESIEGIAKYPTRKYKIVNITVEKTKTCEIFSIKKIFEITNFNSGFPMFA